MGNRSRNDIIADMLDSATSPVTKTRIMYRARLSFEQMKTYHNYLIAMDLIQPAGKEWVITKKGRAFLDSYRKAIEVLDSEKRE